MYLLNIWRKQKKQLFDKYEHKNKINFFSNNKLKSNLEPRNQICSVKKSVYI